MNCLHIVGPPGCGKTHALMERVSALLEAGIHPGEIAFTSFTRSAIHEAQERLAARHGLGRSDLPYFGTLHSLAYRHLMLTQENRVTAKRWREFCEAAKLRFTEAGLEVDEDPTEPVGQEEGDALRRFHDWHRNCLLPLEEAARRFDPGDAPFSAARARWFAAEFEAFKNEARLYDFTDMLLELDRSGWFPPVRVLIHDEAQDDSPLQRRIFMRWAAATGNVLLGYDEDQAIYTFQGAEPSWLLALEGRREFLEQSFRVPQLAASLAQRVIGRNRNRYPKSWLPRAEHGRLQWDAELDEVIALAAAAPEETWYFLARNRFYLEAYCAALKEAAVPFVNLRGSSPKVSGGVLAAFRLAGGLPVTLDAVRRIADATTQKEWWTYGAKAELARRCAADADRPVVLAELEGLGALPALSTALSVPRTCLRPLKGTEGHKEYFLAIWQQGGMQALTREPTVTVSTMHGVKGGGARNVVLSPMMTRRTAEGYDADPEPERRVWYVGVSRTEENLFVLEPSRGPFFDDW